MKITKVINVLTCVTALMMASGCSLPNVKEMPSRGISSEVGGRETNNGGEIYKSKDGTWIVASNSQNYEAKCYGTFMGKYYGFMNDEKLDEKDNEFQTKDQLWGFSNERWGLNSIVKQLLSLDNPGLGVLLKIQMTKSYLCFTDEKLFIPGRPEIVVAAKFQKGEKEFPLSRIFINNDSFFSLEDIASNDLERRLLIIHELMHGFIDSEIEIREITQDIKNLALTGVVSDRLKNFKNTLLEVANVKENEDAQEINYTYMNFWSTYFLNKKAEIDLAFAKYALLDRTNKFKALKYYNPKVSSLLTDIFVIDNQIHFPSSVNVNFEQYINLLETQPRLIVNDNFKKYIYMNISNTSKELYLVPSQKLLSFNVISVQNIEKLLATIEKVTNDDEESRELIYAMIYLRSGDNSFLRSKILNYFISQKEDTRKISKDKEIDMFGKFAIGDLKQCFSSEVPDQKCQVIFDWCKMNKSILKSKFNFDFK